MKWKLFTRGASPSPNQTEADRALETANRQLEATKREGVEVSQVTNDIRRYREENGFSKLFREAMRRS